MALSVLEKKRGATWPAFGITTFRNTVGDFRDFQHGVGFSLDALELAGAVEGGDPLAEVVEGQRCPLWMRRTIIRDSVAWYAIAHVDRKSRFLSACGGSNHNK
jgi:hypothetical protein